MQALILAGGEGTRLRPLTTTVPKPVVPLVDRPFVRFMLDWLHGHGVDDVIMSCGFKATKVRDVLGDGSQYGIRLRFVEEPDPRGTAGALKFAEDLLDDMIGTYADPKVDAEEWELDALKREADRVYGIDSSGIDFSDLSSI